MVGQRNKMGEYVSRTCLNTEEYVIRKERHIAIQNEQTSIVFREIMPNRVLIIVREYFLR